MEASVVPAASSTAALYYGSWLDDASVMSPRSAWLGLSSAYWSSSPGRQVDAPVMAGSFGIGPRAQIGGSVPVYHYRDNTGVSSHGLGNVDLYGKIVLSDPSTHTIGFAVAPLLEIAPSSDQQIGWALPVNLERRLRKGRVYGSAGYFSRGAVFGSLAVEIPAGQNASITASYGETLPDTGSHLTNLGVSAAIFASPTTGFFMSVGQSLGGEPGSAGLSVGGGLSLLFKR